MRKAILMLLLFASHAAMADWTPVGNNKSFTLYADSSGMRKEGELVNMWSLTDFKTVNKTVDAEEYLSIKVQSEYDCRGQQSRLLKFSLHSDKMGTGKEVVSQSGQGKWRHVDLQSVIGSLWNVACGKQ